MTRNVGRPRLHLLFAVIGAVISAVLAFQWYSTTESLPDLRSRGLVVVETETGERPWTVRAFTEVSAEGVTSLTISGFAPPVDSEDKAFSVPIKISFVGTEMQSIQCDGLEVSDMPYSDVSDNVQFAVRMDLKSAGPGSALSQSPDFTSQLRSIGDEDEDPNVDIFSSKADRDLRLFQVNLELWADDHPRWDRGHRVQENVEEGWVFTFAQECVLPPMATWTLRGGNAWPHTESAAFFPPQVNVILDPKDENAANDAPGGDTLPRLSSHSEVERVDRQHLAQSFPEIAPTVYGWAHSEETHQYTDASGFRVDYAIPASYIFEHRNAGLWANLRPIFLGGSISLMLSSIVAFLLSIRTTSSTTDNN